MFFESNAIRQILRQVEERGETATIYDPAGEFVQQCYNPERGDVILIRSTPAVHFGTCRPS